MKEKPIPLTPRKALFSTVLTALFAALIAAGTFISIPLPFSPVPIVLQNLFAVLSGVILGPVMGGLAAALYLLAGAVGLPVFAGAAGGFSRFLGPTGGFLWGYLCAAVLGGFIAGRPRGKISRLRLIIAVVSGFLVVYLPGLLQLKALLGLPWAGTLAAGFLPFIPGDALKAVAAVLIAPRLRLAVWDRLYD
jgi:biotin transport system substrate-specific component